MKTAPRRYGQSLQRRVFSFELIAVGSGGEVRSHETAQDILDRLAFYDEL